MKAETHLADVDGIPTLFAPSAGPMRAGLMFRAGRVDESLPTAGITHLVEHLALHRQGTADYHYNGMTAATTTQFVMQGTPDEVVSFLNGVCESLRDLPLARLATEKLIVETEAANRQAAVNEQLPLWRHGARDYGLISYPEWGLRTLTEDQIAGWAAERFNRANAVLWIAGERIPEGLKLDLPQGKRWPLPGASNALPAMPAYFASDSPLIVMDAHVPRTRAAALYTRLLDRALFRELRQNRGYSYTAAAMYATDGRAHGTVTTVVDARRESLGDALECFLGELARLENDEVDQAEFETVRALELKAFDNPEAEAALLPRRATDLLTGFASSTSAEMIAGFHDAKVSAIPEVAQAAKASALLMVPRGLAHRATGFEAAPAHSRFAVTGVRHRSRVDPGLALVIGADGVSLTGAHGSVTVLFDQCEALLRRPDGARQLFGADGMVIGIEPGVFKVPASALAAIDGAVRPGVIVDLPQRDAAAIPGPSRFSAIRARLRQTLLPWRARLDHRAVVRRGGIRSLVTTGMLITVALVGAIVGITTDSPRFTTLAFLLGVVLVWRRIHLRHW